jgi:hypothetical protein
MVSILDNIVFTPLLAKEVPNDGDGQRESKPVFVVSDFLRE